MTIESNESTRTLWRELVAEMRPIILANTRGNKLVAAEGGRRRIVKRKGSVVICQVCGEVAGSPNCKSNFKRVG